MFNRHPLPTRLADWPNYVARGILGKPTNWPLVVVIGVILVLASWLISSIGA